MEANKEINEKKSKKIDRNSMKRYQIFNKTLEYFMVFLLGCMFGSLWETILVLTRDGYLTTKQAVLYGPFMPVYGIGMLLYYLFLPRKKYKIWQIFLISVLIGGLTEYIFSYFTHALLGIVLWDYHFLNTNINGRTTILFSFFWGLLGLLFIKIYPFIKKMIVKFIHKNWFVTLGTALMTFMIFNFLTSGYVAKRQVERVQNISVKNQVDIVIDEFYPKEYVRLKIPDMKERIKDE